MGLDPVKINVIGDSHLRILKSAQADVEGADRFHLQPLGSGLAIPTAFFEERSGAVEIVNESYREWIRTILGPIENGQPLLVSAPLHPVRVWRHADWRDFCPLPDCSDCGRRHLSTRLVEEIIDADSTSPIRFCEALAKLGYRVYAIEAPRPFRHHSAVEANGPRTVLYLDDFYRRRVKARLAQGGVTVIECPEHCYEDEGFMLDSYRHDHPSDEHHGNRAFGAEVWKRILATVPASVGIA